MTARKKKKKTVSELIDDVYFETFFCIASPRDTDHSKLTDIKREVKLFREVIEELEIASKKKLISI